MKRMEAPIAISSPEMIWLGSARRDADGRWHPVDLPGWHHRFYPYDGTWGWLRWEDDEGRRWVARVDRSGLGRPIPLPPGVEGHLAVAPDGELRAGPLRVLPDGTVLRSPEWIEGAIPGPGGSWVTPNGVQLIPLRRGQYRAIPWHPKGAPLRFLWVGESALALRGEDLVRIARPGAEPETLAAVMGCQVAGDGRWIAWQWGTIMLGDPEGVRLKRPFIRPFYRRTLPLHDGFYVETEWGTARWVREDGRVERLPPIATAAMEWRDAAGWRIWTERGERRRGRTLALFHGGGPLRRLPPHRAVFPGWMEDARGNLWHFPGDGGTPRKVPAPPMASLPEDVWCLCLGGTIGSAAALVARRLRGRPVLIRLLPDGSWDAWELPGEVMEIIRGAELGAGLVVFLHAVLGWLIPGQAVWAPAPPRPSAAPRIRPVRNGWAVAWGETVYLLLQDGEPVLRMARAL